MTKKKTLEYWTCEEGHQYHETEEDALECNSIVQHSMENLAILFLNTTYSSSIDKYKNMGASIDILPSLKNPVYILINGDSDEGQSFYLKVCLKSFFANEVSWLSDYVHEKDGQNIAGDEFREIRDKLKATFSDLRQFLIETEEGIDIYSESLTHVYDPST